MGKILIIGGPKTGKSTLGRRLSGELSVPLKCSDFTNRGGDIEPLKFATKDEQWSYASEKVAEWLDDPSDMVIEGIAVVRGIRKWLKQHPKDPLPFEKIIYLTVSQQELGKGQHALCRSVNTIFGEILPAIKDRLEIHKEAITCE